MKFWKVSNKYKEFEDQIKVFADQIESMELIVEGPLLIFGRYFGRWIKAWNCIVAKIPPLFNYTNAEADESENYHQISASSTYDEEVIELALFTSWWIW